MFKILLLQLLLLFSLVLKLEVAFYNKFTLGLGHGSAAGSDGSVSMAAGNASTSSTGNVVDMYATVMLYFPLSMILLFSSVGLYLITEKTSSSALLVMFLLINLVQTCICVIMLATCYNLDVSIIMDNNEFHNLLITITVIQSLFFLGFLVYSRVLFKRFGWKLYKTQGADRQSLVIAEKYELFIALVKFGIIIYICYFIVYITSLDHDVDKEWYSSLVFLGVLVIMGFVGVGGVKEESKVITLNYCIIMGLLMLYVIFGLKKYYSSQILEVGDFRFNQVLFAFFCTSKLFINISYHYYHYHYSQGSFFGYMFNVLWKRIAASDH